MKKLVIILVLIILISPISFALDAGKLYINNVFIPFETKAAEQKQAKSTFYIYGNGQRIAKKETYNDHTKKLFYFYNDHLGSPRAITDDKGNIVWKADYLPFGELFNEEGSNNVKYNSKELDLDTKLYYYGARYYFTPIGRFITADTVKPNINNPQSLNEYIYTLNNPLKYIDPTGNWEVKVSRKWYDWLKWNLFYRNYLQNYESTLINYLDQQYVEDILGFNPVKTKEYLFDIYLSRVSNKEAAGEYKIKENKIYLDIYKLHSKVKEKGELFTSYIGLVYAVHEIQHQIDFGTGEFDLLKKYILKPKLRKKIINENFDLLLEQYKKLEINAYKTSELLIEKLYTKDLITPGQKDFFKDYVQDKIKKTKNKKKITDIDFELFY